MTAAQQAAQAKQIADLTAMVAALTANVSAPADKKAATTAKAATVKRNLDPIQVTTDDDDVTFTVSPVSSKGSIYANGARVVPILAGKPQHSFTADTIVALTEVADELVKACHTIDKRALIGAHKVVAAKTDGK